MKAFAKVISRVFHPLLFCIYGAMILFAVNPQKFGYFGQHEQILWLIIMFALTVMFPGIWLLMMRGLQMIDNLKLDTTKDRIIPFVAIITFYLWAAWMFKPAANMKIPPNPMLFYMMMGACLSVMVTFFINSFSRISLHAVAAGGLLGLLLVLIRYSPYDLRLMLIGFILLAGLIGTARLILGDHKPQEIYAGYFIGFTGQFIAFSIVPLIV